MTDMHRKKIIALGSGQLGLMLSKAAKSINVEFEAMDIPSVWNWLALNPNPEEYLITFEQEHVDPKLLQKLHEAKISSFPSWEAFLLLKNKLSQKEFLSEKGFPTSPFVSKEKAAAQFIQKNAGGVLKAGVGGYDGKGVWLLDANALTNAGETLHKLWPSLESPFVEKKIDYDFEIASVVCRSRNGAIVNYPTVKSIQKNGICLEVEYTEEFAKSACSLEAGKIAAKIADKLNYVGILAVEFFVSGRLIRLCHAAPDDVFHRVQSTASNEEKRTLFKDPNGEDKEADVVGYGDIHGAYIDNFQGKTLFNVGSVGNPLEITQSSYGIIEGEYEDKEMAVLSITLVRVPYDIEKAVQQAIDSKMPDMEPYINELRTARYRGKNR